VEAYRTETSRLPHFAENRLTDGGEVVNHIRRRRVTPRNIPSTDFSMSLSQPHGHRAARRSN
jgi:hypothetical protein